MLKTKRVLYVIYKYIYDTTATRVTDGLEVLPVLLSGLVQVKRFIRSLVENFSYAPCLKTDER